MTKRKDDPEKARRRANFEALITDEGRVEELIAEIAAGAILGKLCTALDVPYSTLQRWLSEGPWSGEYEAALNRRAEGVMDELKEIEDQVLDGELDPKRAQVIINSKQWRAERLNPRRYGQRSFQHIETTDMTQVHLKALQALQQRRQPAIEARVLPQLTKQPDTPVDAPIASEASPALIPIEIKGDL